MMKLVGLSPRVAGMDITCMDLWQRFFYVNQAGRSPYDCVYPHIFVWCIKRFMDLHSE